VSHQHVQPMATSAGGRPAGGRLRSSIWVQAAPVAARAQGQARAEECEGEREVAGVQQVVLQRAQQHHADEQKVEVVPGGRGGGGKAGQRPWTMQGWLIRAAVACKLPIPYIS
jgi:hypothetical protein